MVALREVVAVVVGVMRGRPHWRRSARPASPEPSLGASRIQEVVKEEGEEGEGVDDPAKLWLLPQPGQPGVQLHAGCGEPLLADRGDVDAAHLKLKLTQLEEQGWL